MLQNVKGPCGNSLTEICLKLHPVSFPTIDSFNTIDSTGSLDPSGRTDSIVVWISCRTLFCSRPCLRLADFYVTWYKGWQTSISHGIISKCIRSCLQNPKEVYYVLCFLLCSMGYNMQQFIFYFGGNFSA